MIRQLTPDITLKIHELRENTMQFAQTTGKSNNLILLILNYSQNKSRRYHRQMININLSGNTSTYTEL